MSVNLRRNIDLLVKNKINEILCSPNAAISDTDHLVYDLKICSDDLSFLFIEELEEELTVYVTQDDWMAVHSIGDAVDLLYRLKITGQTKPPKSPSFWNVLKSKIKLFA